MSIAKKYSKAIIKKFDLIPVYYPGTSVKPGDILDFGGGGLLKRVAPPIGTFTTHGNLSNYHGLTFDVTESKSPKTMNLVSAKEVSIKAALAGEFPGVVEGDVKFEFASAGSFVLFGVDAVEHQIGDLFSLRDQLRSIEKHEDWDRLYIVTSVTICKKALVYAAGEKGGTLVISASSKDFSLDDDVLSNISADATIEVKWKDKAAFSNEWDDNVSVMMKVAQFRKGMIRPYDKMIDPTLIDGRDSSGGDADISVELEEINAKVILDYLEYEA